MAIMINIRSLLPELNPTSSMSDWESAPRNALNIVYPNTLILGCWFHFTQRIWSKVQKFGLVKTFKENNEFASYIRKLMSVPFLPASLIQPTYSFLQLPTNLIASETAKLERISKYFKKRWLTQIRPEELSIFDSDFSTNNGAESYHSRLKARIKTNHPRIWNFMHILNAIIMDTDNELGRLSLGKETTRPRKRTSVANDDRRSAYKLKLATGSYTPWEYLNAISQTIGTISPLETELSDSSDESEVEVESGRDNHNCVVCLTSRETTWVYLGRTLYAAVSVAKRFKN